MKCQQCKGTGKWRQPKNQREFDFWCDHLLEGDFCSPSMAEEKAYKKVGYTLLNCPFCKSGERDNEKSED